MRFASLTVLSVFSVCLLIGCGGKSENKAEAQPENYVNDEEGFATVPECTRDQRHTLDKAGFNGDEPADAANTGVGECLMVHNTGGTKVGDDVAISGLVDAAETQNEVLCKWLHDRSGAQPEAWLCRVPRSSD